VNWLDLVILVCIAVGLIKGLLDGFVKQIVSFIALVAAIFFSGQIAVPVRNFVLTHLAGDSVSPQIVSGFCYVMVFVLIIFVIVLFGKIVDVAIKMTPAKPLNILLGGLFGTFIWVLSLSILFNIFSVFDSGSTILSKQTQEKSVFYYQVKNVVPTVYPMMKNYFQK
jgi:membrane protein required for colicin V production